MTEETFVFLVRFSYLEGELPSDKARNPLWAKNTVVDRIESLSETELISDCSVLSAKKIKREKY